MSNTNDDWKIYMNGDIISASAAKISPFDRGLEYGDAIMESILCYERRIFKLDEHILRLFRSAQHVRLPIPLPPAAIQEALENTVLANRFECAHIKILLTRGIQKNLGLRPRPNGQPTLVILCRPVDPEIFLCEPPIAIRLASVTVRKYPPTVLDPRIKSTNFLPNLLAITEALDAGADEAVVLDERGYVTECAAANLFIVKGDQITTPPSILALEGITRKTTIELARKTGRVVTENQLTQYDLRTADEVFITGTAAGLKPVIAVDNRVIGSGAPGPVFKQLVKAYRDCLLMSRPLW